VSGASFLVGLLTGTATLVVASTLFTVPLFQVPGVIAGVVSDWADPDTLLVDELTPPSVGDTRPAHGYEPEPIPGKLATGTAPTTSAPHCQPGQQPQFVLGFATLKSHLGAAMGEPIECEHPNLENGDSLQQTTNGLAVYEKRTGALLFTDGYRHSALVEGQIVSWEGEARPSPLVAPEDPVG